MEKTLDNHREWSLFFHLSREFKQIIRWIDFKQLELVIVNSPIIAADLKDSNLEARTGW